MRGLFVVLITLATAAPMAQETTLTKAEKGRAEAAACYATCTARYTDRRATFVRLEYEGWTSANRDFSGDDTRIVWHGALRRFCSGVVLALVEARDCGVACREIETAHGITGTSASRSRFAATQRRQREFWETRGLWDRFGPADLTTEERNAICVGELPAPTRGAADTIRAESAAAGLQ